MIQKSDLFFLVIYWLNPWFLFENIIYNPSYLFFFSALHLWTAFKLKEESSFTYSFLHVLSIGMAMQLHYSWIILAIMSTVLLYKNIVKVNWYGVFIAFVVIVISLIPYIQEFMQNEAIRSNEGNKDGERYIGWGGVHVYPVLKSFLYWLRYGSFIFTNKLITATNFDWLTDSYFLQQIFKYTYQVILFAFGAITLWVSFKANQFLYFRLKGSFLTRFTGSIEKEKWLSIYIFSAILGVLISAILSPIIFNYWHLLIIFPYALLPFLIYLQAYKGKKINMYFFPIIIYLLFVNLVASIDSKKFSHEVDYSTQVNQYLQKRFN
ncbi:MAG: 3-deoxy-D-manno-octulosonic acid transferase [Sulfurimonas sp.]|nr:3-deoxy-D-manno-octulosonic acid transferase [Sulfurimonas sp.]